jgi:hypothetical protein
MIRDVLAVLAIVLLLAMVPVKAFSESKKWTDVKWSVAAMTCVPSSSTAKENKYVTTAGRVKFKNDATGTIVFICPVSAPLPDGKYRLNARVKKGMPPSELDVNLREAHKSTGAVNALISADSVSSVVSYDFSIYSGQADIDFQFEDTFYWVQFAINRESTAVPAWSVLGLELVRPE